MNIYIFVIVEGLFVLLFAIGLFVNCSRKKPYYPHAKQSRSGCVCCYSVCYNLPLIYCTHRDRAIPMSLRVLWIALLVNIQGVLVTLMHYL